MQTFVRFPFLKGRVADVLTDGKIGKTLPSHACGHNPVPFQRARFVSTKGFSSVTHQICTYSCRVAFPPCAWSFVANPASRQLQKVIIYVVIKVPRCRKADRTNASRDCFRVDHRIQPPDEHVPIYAFARARKYHVSVPTRVFRLKTPGS
eukprot:1185716-Prorocentrum_minimum.AAC.4